MRGWDCILCEYQSWNRVSGIFPETAWRSRATRQATQALYPFSGFHPWTT